MTSRLSIPAFATDTKAVSDTLGYVFLVSTLVVSIGLLTLTGIPVIEEQQTEYYMSNTATSFELLSDDIDRIERYQSPSRETVLRYNSGVLFLSHDFTVQANITHEETTERHVLTGTPISYAKDENSVHYETGAVIEKRHNNSIMRSQPPFSFRNDKTRLSIITTSIQEDQETLSGTGEIALRTTRTGNTVQTMTGHNSSDPVRLNLTITSPHSHAWETYFEQQDLTITHTNHAENTVTITHTTKEIAIRETLINVRLN